MLGLVSNIKKNTVARSGSGGLALETAAPWRQCGVKDVERTFLTAQMVPKDWRKSQHCDWPKKGPLPSGEPSLKTTSLSKSATRPIVFFKTRHVQAHSVTKHQQQNYRNCT